MTDIYLGPKRYVQLPGALSDAGSQLKGFGRRPMILCDELVRSILRPLLEEPLQSVGLAPYLRCSEWSAAWPKSRG